MRSVIYQLFCFRGIPVVYWLSSVLRPVSAVQSDVQGHEGRLVTVVPPLPVYVSAPVWKKLTLYVLNQGRQFQTRDGIYRGINRYKPSCHKQVSDTQNVQNCYKQVLNNKTVWNCVLDILQYTWFPHFFSYGIQGLFKDFSGTKLHFSSTMELLSSV